LLHRRQFAGFWGIHKILNHRWGSDGWELLIDWEPTRGKAWEPSWEFQKDVTDDILDEYMYFNKLHSWPTIKKTGAQGPFTVS
jgi:hypothetical protein